MTKSTYINAGGAVQGAFLKNATTIKVFPHFEAPYDVEIKEGQGAHGGGDFVMLNDIFEQANHDPLMRSADQVQGAYSILTGIAANKSIATSKQIFIKDLVKGLEEPVFPVMAD
jgi:hypothetical protein